MIICLIILGMIIAGTVLLVIKKNPRLKYDTSVNIEWTGMIILITGIVFSIFAGSLLIANVSNHDLVYQNTLHQREMLEYRIEHMEDNITGNEMLYNDIVEFNNSLRAVKKLANSPWTNWFANQYVADIDYIQLNKN